MLVLLLVASDRLRVGRAFSAAPPTLWSSANATLHQLSPATAGLDAETCIQTKKGGRGEARGELEPPESGRARASCSPPHRGFD